MSAIRFLADESCDFAVVRALRTEGYDVLAVSEVMHRSDDRELCDRCRSDGRQAQNYSHRYQYVKCEGRGFLTPALR